MMMKKNTSYLVTFAAVALFAMMLMSNMSVSMAANCQATELSPCLSAITSSAPPTPLCCTKLKQQEPCLCQYVKNPSLGQYVNSPNARKMAQTCHVAIPKC
ncbi:hypothetical protein MKW94_029769 [Papaver nudicaule]|uniref:Bifunctional inhibitor/plant lipid transfer protein/seed storage helical domain-containing protein n=1 Tax=Papaver nudicaule TaxID=74823 RepID=A0AA41SBL1_PAPNU|nr:hypothetical protein [Papaver nudicaule]